VILSTLFKHCRQGFEGAGTFYQAQSSVSTSWLQTGQWSAALANGWDLL
jgi:hypothetical protein